MAGYLPALGNLFTNAKILAPAGVLKQNFNGDWPGREVTAVSGNVHFL